MSTLGAIHKDPRDILFAPVVSEKSYTLLDEGKYTFLVDQRDVGLHVEDLGRQLDGAVGLARRRTDVNGGHLRRPSRA